MHPKDRPRRKNVFLIAAGLVTCIAIGVVFTMSTQRSLERGEVRVIQQGRTRAHRTPRIASTESLPSSSKRLGTGTDASQDPSSAGRASEAPAVPHEVLITYRSDLSATERKRARTVLGAKLVQKLPAVGAELLRVQRGDVDEVLDAAAKSALVESVEPNYIYRAMATKPNDPAFKDLWGLDNIAQSILGSAGVADADIDATEAWDLTKGSRTVAVGVVDSGVDHNHADLAPNIWTNPGETGNGLESNGRDDDGNGYIDDWRGWDWIDNDNDGADLHGHGTHVAGTIGARGGDGTGITGVNWQVELVPLRVLGADGSGTTAGIASAFAYAGKNGIEVVNASLGGPGFSQTLGETIARYPNTLYIVAAGNASSNNETSPAYPCNYQAANLICVASTTNRDQLSSFSNYGATSVDLAAPGSSVLSTVPRFIEPFKDTFDSDISTRWSGGGTGTTWGRDQDGGGYFLADSPGGNYGGPTDSYVATQAPTSLAGGTGCHLRYDLRLELSSGDILRVEASRDGSVWQKVRDSSGSTSGTWVSMTGNLSAFDGGQVLIRYRLVTAAGTTGRGADVDNVRIRCVAGGSSSNYSYFSGTSMASPHVAGAAALVWSAVREPTASLVRDALLNGTDKKPELGGMVVTGGRLNVNNSLRLTGAGTAVPSQSTTPAPVQEVPSASSSPSTVPEPAAPAPAPPAPAEPAPAPPAPAPPAPAPAEPAPSPSPSGTDPAPAPSATTAPTPAPPAQHARRVSLKLKGELVATGRVTPADGFTPCIDGVPVTVSRNGRRIGKTTTNELGRFRLRLRNRSGHYLAVALPVRVREGSELCSGTASHQGSGTLFRVASSPTGEPAEDCWSLTPAERELLTAIDRTRSNAGAPRYLVDPRIAEVARSQTAEMISSETVFHMTAEELRDRVGEGPVAEKVAVGAGAESLFEAFMASPTERRDFVSSDYQRLGIGAKQVDGRLWMTVIFASGEASDRAGSIPLCSTKDTDR